MSYRYGPSLQAAAYTYGRGGLGIPAELVPAEGADGPAYFYGALSLPADNGVEIRAVITRWPVLGTLTLDGDDGRFSYVGDSDYILWELRAFNQLTAGDIGHGPGIGRTNLLVGSTSELTGAVQLDAAAAAGTMTGGTPSGLSGGVTLADVAAAGALAQEGASGVSGAVHFEDVLASGALTGGAASELGGGVQLDAAQAAGELQGAVVSELGGAVQLGDVLPGGAMSSYPEGAFPLASPRTLYVLPNGVATAGLSELSLLYPARPAAVMDREAVLDFGWDWSAWLAAAGDTVGTLTLRVDGDPVVLQESKDGAVHGVLVSLPAVGDQVVLSSRIETAGPPVRRDERSIWITVVDR